MANLNLYSVDLSLWESAEYLTSQGKSLDQVTRKDWEGMVKGLYDWNWHTQEVEDLCLYGIRVRAPIESLLVWPNRLGRRPDILCRFSFRE